MLPLLMAAITIFAPVGFKELVLNDTGIIEVLCYGWDYKSEENGWGIYSFEYLGTEPVQTNWPVINNPGTEYNPFIFESGTKIGFISEGGPNEKYKIATYDIESKTFKYLGILVDYNSFCRISPDGKRMATALEVNGWWQIVVINLQSGERRQLTNHKAHSFDPSWSADGKRVVYWIENKEVTLDGVRKPYGDHLVIHNLQAGTNTLLTKARGEANQFPMWSPDGKWISFIRKKDGWNVWLIRSDGSEEKQITKIRAEDSYPSWCPDSTHVLFQSYRSGKSFDIYMANTETLEITRLTKTDSIDEYAPVCLRQVGNQ